MTDMRLIARLDSLPEFRELEKHFAEQREEEITKLGRRLFARPEDHDRIEVERLRSKYKGIEAVFAAVRSARAKESR